MAKEQSLQGKIQKWLRSQGYYSVKVITAGRSGVPDVITCVDGLFVAFEVKAPSNELTALQKFNINEIRKSGGIAEIVKSLNEVKKIIGDIKRHYD